MLRKFLEYFLPQKTINAMPPPPIMLPAKHQPRLVTYKFRKRPDLLWVIKPPVAQDDVSISKFLSSGYIYQDDGRKKRMTTVDLAMREITLTFGGTNIQIKGIPMLDQETASVDEIEIFLKELPQTMIIELWYAIGRTCPGWGPDVSTSKEMQKTRATEVPFGPGGNFPMEIEGEDDYGYYEDERQEYDLEDPYDEEEEILDLYFSGFFEPGNW